MATDAGAVSLSAAEAQQRLVDLGLLSGPVPDAADPSFRCALEAFQRRAGLLPTGELDPRTQSVLGGWMCGVPLTPLAAGPEGEFLAEFTPGSGPAPFNKTELTYQLDTLPAGWDAADIIGGINQALGAWSAAIPIRFKQMPSGADIRFRFDGLITPPSGPDAPIPAWATAFAQNRQISFSPSKTFSSAPILPPGVTDMVITAAHEIGHLLGLGHSTNPEAIMYPSGSSLGRALSADDIEGMQRFYGAPAIPVPGWFGNATSGADVALANFQLLPTPPRLDMLVAQIDNPGGADTAYYRVGWDVDANGFPRLGWGPIVPMGGPLGHDSQGLALAVGHIGGAVTPAGAAPDLVMVWMDNPGGENNARYRIGFNPDTSGMNAAWTADMSIPGPWGHETAGMAAAVADLDGNGLPELIVAWVDAPDEADHIYYKIGFNLDSNGVAQQWSPQMEIGAIGHSTSGIGIAVTDLRGNGRPDLAVFWIDDPEGENAAWMRVGRDLDPQGVPTSGWDAPRQIPGWWGSSTCGAGAALANLRGLLRPDLLVLNLDAPDEEDRAHYRVLSPPLPTWNLIRSRSASVRVERAAAVSPSPAVILAASRAVPVPPAAAAPVEILVWDQTDLNENAGSDIVEFSGTTFVEARRDSPVAVTSRLAGQGDVFWIGTNNMVRTVFTNNMGVPGTPATGPTWPPAGIQLPNALAARAAAAGPPPVPGSPLAAASIHADHVGVFYVGPEDELLTQHWRSNSNWGVPKRTPGPWERPVRALTAETRGNKAFLYWIDGVGAIWECSVDDQNNLSGPAQIVPPGRADLNSNVAAVSRGADRMDLFWIEPADAAATGRVMSAFFTTGGGWSGTFEVSGGRRAIVPGFVTAVHAGAQRLQVFWETPGRQIWSTWLGQRPDGVEVPWCPPTMVAPAGSTRPGQELAAVSRDTDQVRLFFVDNQRTLAETFWGATP